MNQINMINPREIVGYEEQDTGRKIYYRCNNPGDSARLVSGNQMEVGIPGYGPVSPGSDKRIFYYSTGQV
jgi:hypothetical protein